MSDGHSISMHRQKQVCNSTVSAAVTLYNFPAVNMKLAMNCNCASPVALLMMPCSHASCHLSTSLKQPSVAAETIGINSTSSLTGSILILKGGTMGAPMNLAVLLYTSGMYRVCASNVTCMRPSPRSWVSAMPAPPLALYAASSSRLSVS